VPHVLLASLSRHGHGYGLDTTVLHEHHPALVLSIRVQLTVPEFAWVVCLSCLTEPYVDGLLQWQNMQSECCNAGNMALLPQAKKGLRSVH